MKLQVVPCLSCVVLLATMTFCQQSSPAVRAELQQGLAALSNGDFVAAEQHFSSAVKLAPNLAEPHANLGVAYYSDHQYEKAIAEFKEAQRLNPSLVIAKAYLPLSQAAGGDCPAAMNALVREFASNPDPKLRRILGLSLQRCADQQGNEMESVQVTQKLMAAYPNDPDVLYAAGELYGRLSSQVYLKLMKVAPKSARSYQVMASFAATDGNWKAALDAYRQAVKLDPTLVGVHLQIAILLLTNSPDPDAWHEALSELQQELTLDPRSAQAEYEIGEVYRKHGQLNEAVTAFRKALEINPSATPARLGLAKALLQLGQKTEALSALEPAAKTDPDDPSVHFLLAQIYRELGRADDAAKEEAEFKRLKPAA
ncbi:MAG: tetratricopeptide repeat protein [Terriglobia bacterium]|jgi:tetratricopeptide (TPR) repeat protein